MILISAGHHPTKPGACWKGFCEHDEALRWAYIIDDKMGEDNCLVVPPSTLKNKVEFINSRNPTLAVEIHFNSAKDSHGNNIGHGCETLYYPGSVDGLKWAKKVQAGISSILGPDRGAKEGYYRMTKDFGPDYFLEKTWCTSIIIEPAFIQDKFIIQAMRNEACTIIANVLMGALQ